MNRSLTAIFSILLLSLFPAFTYSQTVDAPREFEVTEGDTTFIMKQYVFAMYIRGDRSQEFSKTELEEIQKGHLANINKHAEAGKIIAAGPFGDDGEWRGILIFDVETMEEAEEILKQDPAVIAGRLRYELHPWWGAKGTVLK